VVLAAATGWRSATQPAAQQADLTSPGRAFAAFTFTAACGVLGLGLTTVGWPAAGAVLAVAGPAAWLALTALIPARMTASRRARPAIADVNGTWYLWAVATQSLAIMAAFLHTGGALGAGPAAAVALAAWLAGLAIYVLTMAAVVTRLRRVGVGPPGARAGYWVAMGAASISMLAAVHFLGIHGAPVVASARPWITDTAVALWWLATCLIVVLAVATAVMWPRSWRRPRYDRTAWMVVFPLGMYATASQQLGATAGLPAVRMIGEGVTWPAAVAWLAVLAALAAPLLTRAGGRARVAVGLREPPAGADEVCPAGRIAAFLFILGPKQLGQDRGLADVHVASGGQERHRPPGRQRVNLGQLRSRPARVQFGDVAAPELTELRRVMSVPRAKAGRRGEVLGPLIQLRVGLAQASRPYSVHQYPGPVGGAGRVIDTADANLRSHPGPLRRVISQLHVTGTRRTSAEVPDPFRRGRQPAEREEMQLHLAVLPRVIARLQRPDEPVRTDA
jgi:tellurite resistance protein TehA-like permease